jgi:hypothetical protein
MAFCATEVVDFEWETLRWSLGEGGGGERERAVLHLHVVVGRVDIVHSCTEEFY